MRIAVVSEFRPGYQVALEACYVRALRALGHEVTEVATFPALSPWPGVRGRLAGSLPARLHQAGVSRAVLEARPELVLLVKAVGVLAASVDAWARAGAVTINVFPDNPFEVMRLMPGGGSLLHQFRRCRAVFVHDRFAVGQLRLLGVPSRYLAFARDPGLHDQVATRNEGRTTRASSSSGTRTRSASGTCGPWRTWTSGSGAPGTGRSSGRTIPSGAACGAGSSWPGTCRRASAGPRSR